MQGSHLRTDVQGLRAVAVLMVVLYHAGLPLPGGFAGVDVFFVISGFVITASLMREASRTGTVDVRSFVIRRFWRLAPALAVMVLSVLILSVVLVSPLAGGQEQVARVAAGSAVGVANLVIARVTGDYFAAPAGLNPLLHTWSLSVEEQVYIALPVMGYLLIRARRGARVLIIGAVVLTASVSFAAPLFVGDSSSRTTQAVLGFYSPVTRLWEFLVGVGLAAVLPEAGLRPGRGRRALLLVGVAALGITATSVTSGTPWPGPVTLLPVIGTAALIAAGAPGEARGVLGHPLMRWVGDRSYSIYLWHWPIIVLADLATPGGSTPLRVVAAAASLPLAAVLYRNVEVPLREVGHRSRARWRIPASSAVVALPIVVAFGLLQTVERGIGPAGVVAERFSDSDEVSPEVARNCFSRGPFDDAYVQRCTFEPDRSGAPIYLVGDSNAAMFSPAVIEAGAALDRPVVVITTPSCPPLVDAVPGRASDSAFVQLGGNRTEFLHCAEFNEFWWQHLGRSRPGTVVLAWLDQYWWDDSVRLSRPVTGVTAEGSEKYAVFQDALQSTVVGLQVRHDVLMVQSIPTFRNPGPPWPMECSFLRVVTDGCARQVPRGTIDAVQRESRDVVTRVGGATGVGVLDLRESLCEPAFCTPVIDGVARYRDATHLTVETIRAFAGRFAEAIRTAPG